MGEVKMTKRNKKSPSRVRYEEFNPTVSCRVSREVYDQLKRVKDSENRSFADILKIGLGILEVKAAEEGESYAEGYSDGSRDTESAYKVVYRCSVCGELIEVETREEKEAAGRYMTENGWGHTKCHNRNSVG